MSYKRLYLVCRVKYLFIQLMTWSFCIALFIHTQFERTNINWTELSAKASAYDLLAPQTPPLSSPSRRVQSFEKAYWRMPPCGSAQKAPGTTNFNFSSIIKILSNTQRTVLLWCSRIWRLGILLFSFHLCLYEEILRGICK